MNDLRILGSIVNSPFDPISITPDHRYRVLHTSPIAQRPRERPPKWYILGKKNVRPYWPSMKRLYPPTMIIVVIKKKKSIAILICDNGQPHGPWLVVSTTHGRAGRWSYPQSRKGKSCASQSPNFFLVPSRPDVSNQAPIASRLTQREADSKKVHPDPGQLASRPCYVVWASWKSTLERAPTTPRLADATRIMVIAVFAIKRFAG